MQIDLSTYRARIDSIDDIILELLNRRLKYALEINQIKLEQGQQVLDPQREGRILERLQSYNEGPLSQEGLALIYRTIIAESRRLMAHARQEPTDGEAAGAGSA